MFIIKWTNKLSKETGYVEKINRKEGYFENTFEKTSAHSYKTIYQATKAVEWLSDSKEGEINDFSLEQIEK